MNDNLLPSGGNEELLDTDEIVSEDEELDENLFDDKDGSEDDQEDDDEAEDQEDGKKPSGDKIDWKKKYHADMTNTNKRLRQLEKDRIAAQKAVDEDLSDEDLAKLKEKYDEDDIAVIQKLIKKEARALINNDKESALYQKELNIFVKNHPEIEEWELKYVQDMQSKYWFSLEKAYRTAWFGKSNPPKKSHSMWLGWDAAGWSNGSKQKSKDNWDDSAYKDMMDNYVKK